LLTDNSLIFNVYENRYELIVYELDNAFTKNSLIYFVTPVQYTTDRTFRYIQNKITEPLFYPKPFEFSNEDTVNELNERVLAYFKKLYLNENINKDELLFDIYNNIPDRRSSLSNCEYCNDDNCKNCKFDFKEGANLYKIKDMQTFERLFILLLEVKEKSNNSLFEGLDIDENISIKKSELNIYHCLDSFRATEKLEKDNTWYCNICKEHQEAFKQLQIYKAPMYLIIQLKRFKMKNHNSVMGIMVNKKNDAFVDFPIKDLNISEYCVNKDNAAVYDLYAVSQHFGSLSGGHYTAVAKYDNSWYSFNDESVHEISESNVVDESAYLLFYKRKN